MNAWISQAEERGLQVKVEQKVETIGSVSFETIAVTIDRGITDVNNGLDLLYAGEFLSISAMRIVRADEQAPIFKHSARVYSPLVSDRVRSVVFAIKNMADDLDRYNSKN